MKIGDKVKIVDGNYTYGHSGKTGTISKILRVPFDYTEYLISFDKKQESEPSYGWFLKRSLELTKEN